MNYQLTRNAPLDEKVAKTAEQSKLIQPGNSGNEIAIMQTGSVTSSTDAKIGWLSNLTDSFEKIFRDTAMSIEPVTDKVSGEFLDVIFYMHFILI